jgi:hypothetical protein
VSGRHREINLKKALRTGNLEAAAAQTVADFDSPVGSGLQVQ